MTSISDSTPKATETPKRRLVVVKRHDRRSEDKKESTEMRSFEIGSSSSSISSSGKPVKQITLKRKSGPQETPVDDCDVLADNEKRPRF